VALDRTDARFINVVVVHKSNMADPEINALSNGLQQNMLAILEDARSLPMLPEWLQIQAILEVAINEMANGAPVQATLDTAAADVEALLSQAGYY
jgi:multiple sugar transport system substrate-binding protein